MSFHSESINKPVFQFKRISDIDVKDIIKNEQISMSVKILERLSTTKASLDFYFQYINQNPNDSIVVILGIGMNIDNRRSAFDLYFFTKKVCHICY